MGQRLRIRRGCKALAKPKSIIFTTGIRLLRNVLILLRLVRADRPLRDRPHL